jgi:arabinan endo-1,5-alpha-L-arabinosidase
MNAEGDGDGAGGLKPSRRTWLMAAAAAPALLGARWPVSSHLQPPPASTIDSHDPSLARDGDFYYVASTGRGRSPWIPLRRSRDLKSWDDVGQIFDVPPAWIAAENRQVRNLWAPEITRHGDRFHVLYCASRFGTNDSTIARASSPTLDPARPGYGWTDHGPVLTSRPGRDPWNAIDPHLAFDETNQPWLAFGSFWNGIHLVKLDLESLKPAEHAPMQNIARRGGDHSIEAPYLHRRGDWWYLFVSFDLCCRGVASTYRIMVGRSRAITGPYTDRDGRPMLDGGGTELVAAHDGDTDRGPGHCSVLADGDKTWLAHHAYDATRGGRPVLRIRPLTFDGDGWPSSRAPLAP